MSAGDITPFKLDSRLSQDCILIDELPLSRVLMMDDSNYPWLILVPRINNIREIYQLTPAEQQQLMSESSALAKAMADHFQAAKMNIANLGNIVSQLHVHLIARFKSDPAWPGPVWGHQPALKYTEEAMEKRLNEMQGLLSALPGTSRPAITR